MWLIRCWLSMWLDRWVYRIEELGLLISPGAEAWERYARRYHAPEQEADYSTPTPKLRELMRRNTLWDQDSR